MAQTVIPSVQVNEMTDGQIDKTSELIIRHVTVDRSRSPQHVLDATGRRQYANGNVVAAMPHGDGDEVDVIFFKSSRFLSDPDLDKKYTLHGLIPADPYSLGAVNEDDPAFADDHPNATHWQDADGKWCYEAFDVWGGRRDVSVDRNGNDWNDRWWFGGLRKVA